jgi:hypothetical protein
MLVIAAMNAGAASTFPRSRAASPKSCCARLRDVPVAAIGLEPSGGYERGVIRALL